MNYGLRDRRDRPLVTFARVGTIRQKPIDWLVEDWLASNSLAGLIGPPGAYKSFLAIDWACRVATGRDWLGHQVQGGQVYYLAGEGLSGLRRRVSAWEHHNAQILQKSPLYFADSLPPLCDDSSVRSLVEEMKWVADEAFYTTGADPRLIIIDTVARAMGGADENAASEMGKLVQAMDWLRQEFGATVLSVHHTGNGKDRQDRARGSSAYLAALDSACVLKPSTKGVSLRVTKAKDWEEPSPLQLVAKEVCIDGGTSLVLHKGADADTALAVVRRIGELKAAGQTYRQIADETGIPKTSLQRMLAASRPTPP